MSSGGHSFHLKDWGKVAAVLGATAATVMTAGAASPALAGLLGTGAAAAEGAGAAGAAGALGAGAAGAAGAGAAGAGAGAGLGAVAGDAFMPAALATDVAAPSMAAVPGAVAGDAYLPAALQADVSGKTGLQGLLAKAQPYMGRLAKAQQAVKASGLLSNPPQAGGGGGVPPSQAFGQRASPVNLTQFTAQPNSMMQQQRPQLPPQLAMLPPNDPRVLQYLQQMGGMYG